ncbi:MAG TPA: cytochrome c oxidase assembly protein [Gammaproteobacteria bacterium]|nr:cytochrome c oxidase assembly protein [Gammaproteobacteria bacterium]
MSELDRNRANRRAAGRLGLVVLAMFGFGFALVPLYNVFCEITGLNGKTGVVEASGLNGVVDESRLVTVEFTGSVNSSLPWEFAPVDYKMKVHPGKVYEASFIARNLGSVTKVGQAVPSVAPAEASKYFDKTECFCFTAQRFEAGETRELPLRFVVDTNLPPEIKTVILSYTFFERDAKG